MSSTTATARSSAPSSSPKKFYKGGYAKGALSPAWNASPWQRGPTRNQKRQFNKKSGKPHQNPKRQNNNYPEHDCILLRRLSQPFAPPLLERIGGSVEDVEEAASTLSNSDSRIDGERLSEGSDSYLNLPFSATPQFHTPEPGEVERFLESVIGAPPAPSTPSGSSHACSVCHPCLAHHTPLLLT